MAPWRRETMAKEMRAGYLRRRFAELLGSAGGYMGVGIRWVSPSALSNLQELCVRIAI